MAAVHPLPETQSPLSSPEWWARRWHEARQGSVWHCTQNDSPQSWRRFYDQVSSLWPQMSGHGAAFGRAAAQGLAQEGLLRPGSTVLDVGSGPGDLSLALAARGARVTALDDSPAMLRCLAHRAREAQGPAPSCVCADWQEHAPTTPHDLVVAAFFPQALEPAGLARLAEWSQGACALLLGVEGDVFAFRREIVRRLLPTPAGPKLDHLDFACNYLSACGHEPTMRTLAWPVSLDLPYGEVIAYFRSYLAIFGQRGPRAARVVAQALEPYTSQGRVRASGINRAALVWWPARPAVARAAVS